MRKIISYIAVAFAATVAVASCKTTEANYREAYEKAIAGRDADDAIDSTIYGNVRRQYGQRKVATASGDTLEVRSMLVRIVKDEGAYPERLKRYNVVAGQFKQIFNARSMRNRIAGHGYPGAFVVETAEPYYYVVASSHYSTDEAAAALEALKNDTSVVMRAPVPFVLDATVGGTGGR